MTMRPPTRWRALANRSRAATSAFLQQAFGLESGEWQPAESFDLGWRSREYLWFMEFTLPGLTPVCRYD